MGHRLSASDPENLLGVTPGHRSRPNFKARCYRLKNSPLTRGLVCVKLRLEVKLLVHGARSAASLNLVFYRGKEFSRVTRAQEPW